MQYVVYVTKQLLKDFEVYRAYIKKYLFCDNCNINRAAVS